MKQIIFFLFIFSVANAQYTLDADYFYGKILPHSSAIKHLILKHPEGILLSFNKKTFGEKEWQSNFNFPDYGFSMQFQSNKNPILGDLYGAYAHYNFYFFKRNLVFRAAQGIAYSTNPFDDINNFRNVAYSTKLMPSAYFLLNYRKEKVIGNIGFQTGMSFFHHSNGSIKSPNTSTNAFTFQLGLNYAITDDSKAYKLTSIDSLKIKYLISYNIAFRTGINEGDVIGSGQRPFYELCFFADKQYSKKSKIQLGIDLFAMYYLKEYIKYKAVAYPNENIKENTDFKRIGLFIGYELLINKLSFEAQVGYYVYEPFDYLGPFYQRISGKYHWNNFFFSSVSLKTHAAKAEALEFGIGLKL
ncbi:acyloxyacyl hydrolase [uncultured Flavobacterium sp.]|uniref:acyloxyacyl hydrolase n=1 Tax=uncultured Flavobacterium sp. TaxID=165435 RepID=UPI0030CA16D6